MRIKFGDILLAFVIAAVAVLLIFLFKPEDAQSLTAVIIKNGEEIKRVNLSEPYLDQTITINDGADIEIVVENGRIRFTQSSCRDKTCINTGWLDSPGDTAACLPNRTIIKIIGNTESGDVDIIAE